MKKKRSKTCKVTTCLKLYTPIQYFRHLMWRTDSLKRPRCWERLKAGGQGDHRGSIRGWDGWMASTAHWWWTGRPGVLQSMGSQRVRHDCTVELNWTPVFRQLLEYVLHQNKGVNQGKENTRGDPTCKTDEENESSGLWWREFTGWQLQVWKKITLD